MLAFWGGFGQATGQPENFALAAPDPIPEVDDLAYEAARVHEQRYKEFGARMGPMGDLVRDGLLVMEKQYEEAKRTVADARKRVAEIHRTTPVILVQAAPGQAPKGLGNTGDPRMNSPWTALGTPAISIPMSVLEFSRRWLAKQCLN
jgi:hypothetical protein